MASDRGRNILNALCRCRALGQKLVNMLFGGSTIEMVQSSASNVVPIQSVGVLPAGAVAPNFTLHVTPDQTLTMSELPGRPVILAFYPADWSPVCGDQMALYNEIPPEFRKFGAELLGVSVDGAWCHDALRRIVICIFSCSPILSLREPSPDNMARIALLTASASALFSSSTTPV